MLEPHAFRFSTAALIVLAACALFWLAAARAVGVI